MWHRTSRRTEDTYRKTAAARLRRVPTPEVLDWADLAGTGVAKALQDYRKDGQTESLLEARNALSSMCGALDVVEERDPGIQRRNEFG